MRTATKLIILLFAVASVYSCGQKHSRFSDAEAKHMRARFDSCIAFNNKHRLEAIHIIDTMLSVYEEVENMPVEVLTEKQQKMRRQIFIGKVKPVHVQRQDGQHADNPERGTEGCRGGSRHNSIDKCLYENGCTLHIVENGKTVESVHS